MMMSLNKEKLEYSKNNLIQHMIKSKKYTKEQIKKQ